MPKKSDILKWVEAGEIIVPRLVDVVLHYVELAGRDLPETDKERMKKNLEELRLKPWEEL